MHQLLPPPRLAVLDLAGTTVTDDGVVEAAFADALRAVGVALDERARRHVADTMGQSKIVVFRSLLGTEDLARSANEAFEDAFATRVASGEVAPIDGAVEAMDRLRAAGLAICLTTGFAPATRDVLLDHLGWADRVDLVLSPDADVRGRPFPDLVLTAALRLRIDDVRSVAVAGDTANDLLSGWRAGAGIVAGVTTGAHDRRTLAAAPHTHILDSIRDLPAAVLD